MKRIIAWIVCLAVVVIYICVYNHIENSSKDDNSVTKKETAYIYSDVENDNVLQDIFAKIGFSDKYKIIFTDGIAGSLRYFIFTNDLELISEKSADDETLLTSYTPLIIGLKNSKNLQKFAENGLLISSKDIDNSVDDEISIDFKKIIEAVNNGDNWSVFGGEEIPIKIFIPGDDSIEAKIFYNFLLVTINNGIFPENDEILKETRKIADSFLESSNCIKTENVINEINKISSINATDIYVLFEADFINSNIWTEQKLDISLVYPNVTLVKHIYSLATHEEFETTSNVFYSVSEELNYRTSNTHSFDEEKNYNVSQEVDFIEVELTDIDVEEGLSVDEIVLVACCVLVVIMLIAYGCFLAFY